MKPNISVVVPVYNSEYSLDELCGRLIYILSQMCFRYELILVDDGSNDKSYNKMLELHKNNNHIKAIQLRGNFGQQNALICGFHYAVLDYVVTMDDDLQHPPEEIPKLYEKILEGYDIVYGIPIKKQHSSYRNLGTKATDLLFDKLCSKPHNIKVSSFRIMKKDLVQKITLDKTSFVYLSAMTFKNTNKVANVYVNHNCRKYGKSNYTFLKLFKLYTKLYIYYSSCLLFKIFKSKRPQFIVKDIQL